MCVPYLLVAEAFEATVPRERCTSRAGRGLDERLCPPGTTSATSCLVRVRRSPGSRNLAAITALLGNAPELPCLYARSPPDILVGSKSRDSGPRGEAERRFCECSVAGTGFSRPPHFRPRVTLLDVHHHPHPPTALRPRLDNTPSKRSPRNSAPPAEGSGSCAIGTTFRFPPGMVSQEGHRAPSSANTSAGAECGAGGEHQDSHRPGFASQRHPANDALRPLGASVSIGRFRFTSAICGRSGGVDVLLQGERQSSEWVRHCQPRVGPTLPRRQFVTCASRRYQCSLSAVYTTITAWKRRRLSSCGVQVSATARPRQSDARWTRRRRGCAAAGRSRTTG